MVLAGSCNLHASHMLTVNNTCSSHMYTYTHEPSNYSWLDYSTMMQQYMYAYVVLDGSGICQSLTIWLELCMGSDCNIHVLTYMYLQ